MRRALIVVVSLIVVAVVLAIASIDAFDGVATRAANRQWPAGLGTIDDVPARFPVRTAPTPAAMKLAEIATPLGVDIEPHGGRPLPRLFPQRNAFEAIKKPLSDYVEKQLSRPNDRIDPPPPLIAEYLDAHRVMIDAVRAHLLAEQPVAWKVRLGPDAPIPNLVGHLELSRVFVADALARPADAAAWDDLHAVWLLDRSLLPRPDLISQLIALAMSRMTTAAASKMPLPPPSWLTQLLTVDMQRPALTAVQAELWSWLHERNAFARFLAAGAADRMRSDLQSMVDDNECDFDGSARHDAFERSMPIWNPIRALVPNVWSPWQRLRRFVPEREATEKILQLRSRQTPSPRSRCSDGNWLVTPKSLKFSRDIPVPVGTKYPLEFVSDASE